MKKTTFQEGLLAFMKRKDYTQSTLADAIGVTRMALNYWVHGKHEPLLKDIKKLLDVGMSLEEIFGK